MRIWDEPHEEIEDWLAARNIQYTKQSALVNPQTFEVEFMWVIPNEEHRTMFALKWSK